MFLLTAKNKKNLTIKVCDLGLLYRQQKIKLKLKINIV